MHTPVGELSLNTLEYTLQSSQQLKMKFFKSENVFDSIKPLYYLSRVFAQCPYTISKNNVLKTTLIDIFLLFCNTFIFGILLWYNLTGNIYEIKNFEDLSKIGIQIGTTIGLIYIFLLCIVDFIFTKNAKLILTSLHEIDRDLKTIQIEVNHGRINKICWAFILTIFVCLGTFTNGLAIYFLSFETKTVTYSLFISLFIVNIIFSIHFLNFLFYVHAIWLRFHYLNKGLINNQFLLEKNKFAKINTFAIIHDKLNDVVEIINFHYSVGIMVGFANTFFFAVINTFSAIRVILNYDYNSFVLTIVYTLLTSYYTVYVISVIFIASKATREVRIKFSSKT